MKPVVLLLSLLIPQAAYCQIQVETRVERFPDGMPRAEYSFYRDGKGNEVWHGKRTEWTHTGQKFSEGTYLNGKAEGRRTYWHGNGQKSAEGDYRDDVPVGVWVKWYADGRLQEKCEYENGHKHGTCTYWGERGGEVDTVRYVNGKPLAVVEWEKRNAGKHKGPVYLYPYIVVRPGNLLFASGYAGISREFPLEELEQVFASLPESVWVNGREIGLTAVGLASAEDTRLMDERLKTVEEFFRGKGYRVRQLSR
jgi:hypothetical protein